MATETPATGRPAEPDAPMPPGSPDAAPDPGASTAADGAPDEHAHDPALADIAMALFHLRRVWAKPDLMRRIRAQTSACADGRPLQLSNLMVVNAVAALSAAGPPEDSAGRPGEVTVGAVAERLEIDPSTASRLVGHAIDAGLVSRRPSPVDARRANLGLTEAGQRVKRVADRSRRDYLDALMAGWSADERAEFARLLSRFADAAARAPEYSDGIGRIFEEAAAD
ncbi:DNA-binding transcriptional regulator, MarR family [Actinomadura meyerae]|uniref:DNA-binding transcriptional regulator, MarR family n=1 Tax=Actinomadura meyerae TaxID=240840 RepID=A0A239P3G5_9ACTN|nr:MarR family winged helix-turn-helix transcriptional regulator [Actinomadura meyerae]SNT61677.1 DNA-binding transcriptional regulator, MarR family [Actinomadura meyerae]